MTPPRHLSPNASPAELLAATAAGDRVALGRLVERYVDLVYAAACRQSVDRATAEDVTQTVFLTLAKKAGRVRPPALATWLHRTTRYTAMNANRASRRRAFHEHAAAATRAEAVSANAYVLPEPDPLLPLLDEAIAALRAGDRRLVVERYLRGRSVDDVARDLGLPVATARKRLTRAVGRLRNHFARRGVPTAACAAVAVTLTAAGPSSATASAPPTLAALVAATAVPALPASAWTAGGLFAAFGGVPMKAVAGAAAAVVLAGVGVVALPTNAAAPVAATQPAATQAVRDIRTYDVRRLQEVSKVADFNSSSAPPRPGDPPAATDATIAAAKRVTAVVGALVRERNARGSVRELGGQLVVEADAATHAAIRRLLADTNATYLRQVMIEARVVRLPLSALTTESLRQRLRVAEMTPAKFWAVLDRSEADALARALDAPGVEQVTAPRLTLFSGQRAYLSATTDTVDRPTSGFKFDARAAVAPDGESTALSFELWLKRDSSDAKPRQVDRLGVVPEDATVLCVDEPDPADPDRRTVVLVKATPIVQREIGP